MKEAGFTIAPVLWIMCLLGLLLHFMIKYGSVKRIEKISAYEYLSRDSVTWVTSLIAAIACMGMLPTLPQILGLPPEAVNSNLMRVLAFFVGYTGSSLAVNIVEKVQARIDGKPPTPPPAPPTPPVPPST